MIAYLQGKDVTVEVPDDIGDKDLATLAEHFDTMVEPEAGTITSKPASMSAAPAGATEPSAPTQTPADATNPSESGPSRWRPDFYESFIKPALARYGQFLLPGTGSLPTSEGRAVAGKATEEATFGVSKPLTDALFAEDYKAHPVYAAEGALAGGVGSLLAVDGALKIAGLEEIGKELGTKVAAAETGAGLAAITAKAPRFLPRAIMTGATFGTQTFIKETVKAFQDGNVDLPSFGMHVIKDTALGNLLGAVGGLENASAAIASAAGLGFVSAKIDRADNADAAYRAALWGAFEAVGSFGRTAELRRQALDAVGDSTGRYVRTKEPAMSEDQAKVVGDAIVRQAADRVGGIDAVVKGENGETLKLIEDINQRVLQGKIQEPIEAPKELTGSETSAPAAEPGPQAAPEPPNPGSEPVPAPGKPVKLDDQGIPKLKAKAVVLTVDDPDGQPVKITHQMILEEAKGLDAAQRDTSYEMNPLARFVLDNGGVKGFKGGVESEEFKGVPVRFRGTRSLDEMAQEAYNAGVLSEPSADTLRLELASMQGRPDLKPMAQLYEDAKQNLSDFFASTLPGEIPSELEPGVAFSRVPGESGDLVAAPKENIVDRYERARQAALSQGMNPAQASKYAKDVLRGSSNPAPRIERTSQQQEFGATGGVQGFGQGRQGEQELFFDRPGPGQKQTDTPAFKKWFGDSKVVDESGKPTIVYHGTGNAQNIADKGFSPEFVGKGNDTLGSGFYFTNKPETASGYTSRRVDPSMEKIGGESSPGVFPVYLSLKKPVIEQAAMRNDPLANIKMTPGQVKKMILAAPDIRDPDGPLSNWGDVRDEGFDAVLAKAVKAYTPTHSRSSLANDIYPGHAHEFLRELNKLTGYDGVIVEFPNGEKHYVAWFPEQIKSALGNRGTFDPNNPNITYAVAPGGPVPKPIVRAVADNLKASATEIRDILTPDKAAPLAARIFREKLGQMARAYDKAEASLEDARRLFAKQPNDVNLAFIDKLEHGQKQEDPQFDRIATIIRAMLDHKRKEIQALGTGKLSAFIKNYFPHIWKEGEEGVSQAIQKGAKRPMEGRKSFLKKRTLETIQDGIELGLQPVSYNPVELVLLKMREMDKYLMAHQTLQELKAEGLAQYVKVGKDAPEGWTKIDDRISTIFKSPMIAVQEAFDEEMVNKLKDVAESLGITLERGTSLRKFHAGVPEDVWGFATGAEGEPGRIATRFAGPESAYAHELGHRIDSLYGLKEKFDIPANDKELAALARERAGEDAKPAFLKYIQKPEERMAVMLEAYIHSPELFKEKAPTVFKQFDTFLKSKPELKPLTDIKPSLRMGTAEGEVHAGGAVIAGHIWAHPDAARIINNYLSPGLQKSAIYRTVRAAGNFLNQAQLGFSLFHLGFTSGEAIVSKNALALMELMAGKPMKAIAALIRSPIAPIENIIRGDALLKAWRGQGQSPVDEILAEAMASAGGRARMDQFYQTRAIEKVIENFKNLNIGRGLLQIPLALTEVTTRPILEYVVPRQKLGIFADMMKSALENNPRMTHDEMRAVAQRIWNSIDNRMGQMVYDNLFWNRTLKDLLMASVRSVGWNLGTIREIGGGGKDTAAFIGSILKGEKPEATYRMAYIISLIFTAGLAGAIYQYLRTGQGPQEPKDYFFPRTKGSDENSDVTRVSLPFYIKDIYHWKTAPLQTAANKVQPMISAVIQMLQNKDYYGTKIRNEDDPIMRQILSELKFAGGELLPFSVRGVQRNFQTENRSLADVIGPWVGVVPAPRDINQTPAERLAHEIAASHVEVGGRTRQQVERSRFLSDIRRRISGGDQGQAGRDLMAALVARRISSAEAMDVYKTSRMTPLQRAVHSFTYDELKQVYKKANEEEKAQLEPLLRQREISNIRQFGAPVGRQPF